jgi:hypothetical protein
MRERGLCPLDGCVAGTHPKALEKLEKRKQLGYPCLLLECAVNNKVDYCLRCDKFPCNLHYQEELYSKKTLDGFKEALG